MSVYRAPLLPIPPEVRLQVCTAIGVRPEEVAAIHIYPTEVEVEYLSGTKIVSPIRAEEEQR
jgi:hypothetical protein